MHNSFGIRTIVAIAAVVVASLIPGSVQAQKTSPPAPTVLPDTSASRRDTATVADVQRAAEQLSIAVQEAVRKATESPELKVAAIKLATNAVKAAQVVVAQQAVTLQTVLESLAREVAAVSTPPAKPKAR
ncbi:MAG: hypothetical protein WKF55_15330 [Gemmatimonadaceae bacterium]